MEEENLKKEISLIKKEINLLKTLLVGVVAFVLISEIFGIPYLSGWQSSVNHEKSYEDLEALVIPKNGYNIPIKWRDLGKKMVEAGVIDKDKFESIYAGKGRLSDLEKELLYGSNNEKIHIDLNNSGTILNLLWAFGLSNKTDILEMGPMVSEQFGGDPSRFASTGGWTLSSGNSMDHYSKHEFVSLNDEQKQLVKDITMKIYRPCCNNSTFFPDCNHGMAMLGLVQLLASENLSESEIMEVSLKVNSYWFPDQYLTIAKYLDNQDKSWKKTSAEEILGADYSSATGFGRIKNQVNPGGSNSSSCSV